MLPMRVHYLQHVPFEGLGCMEPYLTDRGHELTSTHLYSNEALPLVRDLDWLIVMGGPMGVYDHDEYPWLAGELVFISDAIDSGKVVLGICLGAQLVASALGARVIRGGCREIGWFPIIRAGAAEKTILREVIPASLEAFHWHGDTFDLPVAAHLLASSEACSNQGYIYDNRVIGFQFHLESTLESAAALIDNCHGDLDGGRHVQSEAEMLADESRFTRINDVMLAVLARLESNSQKG